MRYSRVVLESMGYELAPVVVTSGELEERLEALYSKIHLPQGQLESLTGIVERRWWEEGYSLTEGAVAAGRKALDASGVSAADLGVIIYAGVNREHFEPATACAVASALDLGTHAAVYDISNACLGVMNGMIDVANRIELGQIRAGLVVSCETAREINEIMIDRMLEDPVMGTFTKSLATLTGGSGAAAVLLTDGSFGNGSRRLLGGVACAAPQHHGLCHWGLEPHGGNGLRPYMATDAVSVLKYGVELGKKTWEAFLKEMDWTQGDVDKVICHQVGSANRNAILKALGVSVEKDFQTYEFLGNMGTVSLPMTAAIAEEREFLTPGDRVSFLGIGSGLNCIMLGLQW